jgi:hypothetical protein
VSEPTQETDQAAIGSVGEIAQLYLGNILYALEMAALSLEQQNKPADASFYRGIAHKLADAHGNAKQHVNTGERGE